MIITLKDIRQPIGETGIETGSADAGGMSVLSHIWPTGFDATDLLKAACGDVLCPVAHYFIVVRGRVGIRYTDDGSEEQCGPGEVAYLRPGHTIRAIQGSEVIEISSAEGTAYLNDRLAKTGLLG